MRAAIESGMAKLKIEEAAAHKQAKIDSGQDIIVGVNKYRLEKEETVDVLAIDNKEVREKQIQRINEARNRRDKKKWGEAMKKLETIASSGKGNLLAAAIECARVRATVGEISDAMEKTFGRYVAKTQVVSGAYRSSYGNKNLLDDVTKRMQSFEKKHGRRPRILVAKMGQDGHDRGAKVIASRLADLGFDVDVGPLFATPEEVAQQALDSDVHVVGVSSQAGAHLTLLPELIKNMKAKGGENILIVVGGVIPPKDYQALHDAGVTAIFGPGTVITQAAIDLIEAVDKQSQKTGSM